MTIAPAGSAARHVIPVASKTVSTVRMMFPPQSATLCSATDCSSGAARSQLRARQARLETESDAKHSHAGDALIAYVDDDLRGVLSPHEAPDVPLDRTVG